MTLSRRNENAAKEKADSKGKAINKEKAANKQKSLSSTSSGTEELRQDSSDNLWYSRSDFITFYGGTVRDLE